MMQLNPCLTVLKEVLSNQHSLTACFEKQRLTPEQKAICYGVIRWEIQLKFILSILLHKPLSAKNNFITLNLYMGLFQILYGQRPDYAVVAELVEHIKQSKFRWAAGLVNKLLRKLGAEREQIMQRVVADPVAYSAHPMWMIKRMSTETLDANNQQAPMTLRVNLLQQSQAEYLRRLNDAQIGAKALTPSHTAVQLDQAVDVQQLPGFYDGCCSIQDEAGQLVATALKLKPGLRVLDACCAPGSKTGHILETEPHLEKLVALDIDAKRLKKVSDNLKRLKLDTSRVSLIVADANRIESWCDDQYFDRILIDAPCSASGVIRRHPDIKLLRRESDLQDLQQRQLQLLTQLSTRLDKNGLLIYSTCSVFEEENSQVIMLFLKEHNTFNLITEQQLYPKKNGGDGFYIATLAATTSSWSPNFCSSPK